MKMKKFIEDFKSLIVDASESRFGGLLFGFLGGLVICLGLLVYGLVVFF